MCEYSRHRAANETAMTLWHLLLDIAFTSPLSVALIVGIRTCRASGIVAALLLGIGISIASVYGLDALSYEIYRRAQKIASEATQTFLFTLLYLGALVWIVLTSILTNLVAETVCRFITS